MTVLAVYLPDPELSIYLPAEIVGQENDPVETAQPPSSLELSVYLPPEFAIHSEELIAVAQLPLLPASQIGSGILDPDRIPPISVDKLIWDTETEESLDRQEAEADNSIIVGQPLYLKENGHADLASAAAIGSSRICGLARANAAVSTSVSYSPDGVIELASWTLITESTSLTPGAIYFLSPVPGKLTTTAPTEAEQVVIAVGQALSPSRLAIEIQSPFLL